MRLLLLPISTRRALIYCQPASTVVPNEKQSWLDWGVGKANKTWVEWETSDKNTTVGGVKVKVTQYGNQFLRRIPFEEWGLKSIPGRKKLAAGEQQSKVEVAYPALYQGLQKESLMDVLKRLSTERQGLHKNRLMGSVALMPLTIPVGLIPIMPNFPFLYLAFRAYSHWRALLGSRHLDFLVGSSLITTNPQGTLDSLYTAGLLHHTQAEMQGAKDPSEQESKKVVDIIRRQMQGGHSAKTETARDGEPLLVKGPPPSTSTEKDQATWSPTAKNASSSSIDSTASSPGPQQEEEIMLLRGWSGRVLAERLNLPGLELEIERAVEQVESALMKEKEAAQSK